MNPQILETITKAKQTANLLNADIREAHRSASQEDARLSKCFCATSSATLSRPNRLAEIESCLR